MKGKLKDEFGIDSTLEKDNEDQFSISIKEDKTVNYRAGSYSFEVNDLGLACKVFDRQGAFNFVQTFLQMIYIDRQGQLMVESVKVVDYPQYQWRGLMVDVARHFFPKEVIFDYIDMMARYKYNLLHLHLTDDQGWRVEIKSWPNLTKIGSMREDTKISFAAGSKYEGKPHGGFFTQEDIIDIVEFADSRGVIVVPEIDMPGHMVSAIASYPQLSCLGQKLAVRQEWGVSLDLLCPGKDTSFQFLDDVIGEVAKLFPGKYLHLGGDEAPLDRWKSCPLCQEKIVELGLDDEHDLMAWFFRQAVKIIESHGKKAIAWFDGFDYPEGTPLYLWRNQASGLKEVKELTDRGYPIIFTPGVSTYFDYNQARKDSPIYKTPIVSLKKVYEFDLSSYDKLGANILGSQGNLWSEYLHSREMLFFQTYPRAFALSEVLWTPSSAKDWNDFTKRVKNQFTLLEKLHITYRPLQDKEAFVQLQDLNKSRY